MDLLRLRELAISDAGFVFDPISGQTYNVNPTGLAILQALKNGESPEGITNLLRDSFDGQPEVDVSRDLEEFLSQLREHGLVR